MKPLWNKSDSFYEIQYWGDVAQEWIPFCTDYPSFDEVKSDWNILNREKPGYYRIVFVEVRKTEVAFGK